MNIGDLLSIIWSKEKAQWYFFLKILNLKDGFKKIKSKVMELNLLPMEQYKKDILEKKIVFDFFNWIIKIFVICKLYLNKSENYIAKLKSISLFFGILYNAKTFDSQW
jgi:hypothetical protein